MSSSSSAQEDDHLCCITNNMVADDKPKRPRPTVSFSEMACMYEFDDYSPHRVTRTYYNKGDYDSFEANRVRDIRVINRHNRGYMGLNAKQHCQRGLERWLSKETIYQCKARKQTHVESVLEEQMRQEYLGLFDPEQIRKIASERSLDCRLEAEQRATSYAKEEGTYVVDTENLSPSSPHKNTLQSSPDKRMSKKQRHRQSKQKEKQNHPPPPWIQALQKLLLGHVNPKSLVEELDVSVEPRVPL